MKRFCGLLVIAPMLLLCSPLAQAQNTASFGIGFGTNHDGPSGAGIDNANSANALGSCDPNSGDIYCEATPGLNGFFLGIGGDGFISKRFGIGGEVSFMPAKGNYGPVLFRQTFYDVNAIFRPISTKHVEVKLMGGIGGAKTGLSFSESSCVGTVVCQSQTLPVGSANHFQIHVGAGVEFPLSHSFFIRPQFDVRYVPGLSDEFSSNLVPGGMLWIGFRTGGH